MLLNGVVVCNLLIRPIKSFILGKEPGAHNYCIVGNSSKIEHIYEVLGLSRFSLKILNSIIEYNNFEAQLPVKIYWTYKLSKVCGWVCCQKYPWDN